MSSILLRSRSSLILLFSCAFFASQAQAVEPGGTCPQTCTSDGDCEDNITCSTTDVCTSSLCSRDVSACPDCTGDKVADYCVESVTGSKNWSDPTAWPGMASGFPGDKSGRCGLIARVLDGASIKLDTDATINEGQIIIEGDILVVADHALSVPDGTVLITGSGRYLADPDTGAGTTASLSAGNITLKSSNGGCGPGPELIISQSMTVTTTTGDLVLDLDDVALGCPNYGANAASRGGKTPPILKVAQATAVSAEGRASAANAFGELNIAGSFEMIVAAEVCVGCEPGRPLPIPIVVGADFRNRSTHPEIFNWIRGTLRLPAGAHTFEVGGVGLGALHTGFSTTSPTPPGLLHTNFSMDHIHIEGNVNFVNVVKNTVGSGPGNEALYVRKITLGPGSTATTDGSMVFYCELENNTGLASPLNDANFIAIPDCPALPSDDIPTVSAWGVVILAALLLCVGTLIAKRRSIHIAI